MREPGEDGPVGEYYQVGIGETAPAPSLGVDHCGCPKPAGCWGAQGFHLRPDPQRPDSLAAATIYERCPAYSAAVARSRGYQTKRTGRRTKRKKR